MNEPIASSLLVRTLPKSLAWPNCTSNMGAAASESPSANRRGRKPISEIVNHRFQKTTGWFSACIVSQKEIEKEMPPSGCVRLMCGLDRLFFEVSRTALPLALEERRK
jgi:hypothetical protein